jgi:ketosteroid isomerase-like protein
MKLYAPEGVFMAQHLQTDVGTEEVRKAYDITFNMITLSVEFDIIEVVPINPERAFAHTCVRWDGEGEGRRRRAGCKSRIVCNAEC